MGRFEQRLGTTALIYRCNASGRKAMVLPLLVITSVANGIHTVYPI